MRLCSVSRHALDDVVPGDASGQNLSWIVTETIHLVNNVLAGIQYALYFLRDEEAATDGSNVQLIQERTDESAAILRSLYELVSPLAAANGGEALDILCERIRSLLARRMTSQGVAFSADLPERLVLPERKARLFSQILFTYLWLRLGELTEGDTLALSVREENGGVWLQMEDSGASFRVLPEDEHQGADEAAEDFRERFARRSLKQLVSRLGPGGFRALGEARGYSLMVNFAD